MVGASRRQAWALTTSTIDIRQDGTVFQAWKTRLARERCDAQWLFRHGYAVRFLASTSAAKAFAKPSRSTIITNPFASADARLQRLPGGGPVFPALDIREFFPIAEAE